MDSENQESAKSDANHLKAGGNIILIGAMGSGKSTVGWLLSRLVGFGFVDLDTRIEKKHGQTVEQMFEDQGESKFREMEKTALSELVNMRSHVIAVGGGAVVDDDNWKMLRDLGVTIFLDTPADEISRRLSLHPDEITKRPLLKEVLVENDPVERRRVLTERISALISFRISRYNEADLTLGDAFSTPDSSAKCIVDMLVDAKYYEKQSGTRHFDKWDSL